ncbi:MAG TPA: L,D-transpeptidase family protein [Xanthobacteraceae bacterium]|nr:L,D-transpeptidase family protein [Xanthobacteraceae bacterium]
MSGPRYERVLASTALALMLAAPIGAAAQDAGAPATAPAAVAPAGQPLSESGRVPTPSEPAATPAEAAAVAGAAALSGAPAAPSAGTSETGAAPAAIASEQTAAPDPLASLDPADRAVAEKIRDLLAAKSDKIFANKRERAAVESFYQARHLAPLWLDKGVENARARAVIARLKGADADGLDVNDYNTPAFAGLSPDALAEAELKLTQTVLTYARHLQAGRFPYTRVSQNIELPQAPPDPAEVLAKIGNAANTGTALDDFSPPHEGYKQLKAMLAQMRTKVPPAKEIADGQLLKLNAKLPMEDPRVPMLRERLGLVGDASDLRYDAKIAEAVKKFQHANELPVTGNLDARTIKELNGSARDRQIETIISNMERWRWYPRDLGAASVIVNLPDFTLRVIHNATQIWSTRIVIGKQDMPTPLLSETMKFITINPTWNVPPSIVNNEYLPWLQRDPAALERMGLRVTYNRDGSIHIYQPPGEANALGRIRFNFPNRFLVYQHDTPDKHLFAHDVRAYSHGCMRVQDPAKYAEVLLNIARPNESWTADKVKRMFGTGEQDIQLPAQIWVLLTYQNAFIDEAGKLQIRRDIYNIDSRTIAAIKTERGIIEPAQERKREQEAAATGQRRSVAAPRTVSFFEALFGFGRPMQARPVPPRGITR